MGIIVLGCGNLLAYDEGVGIHVIRILKQTPLPENVKVIELKNPGISISPIIENAGKIIIIDALKEKVKGSGTIHRLALSWNNLNNNLKSTIHGFNLIQPLKKA